MNENGAHSGLVRKTHVKEGESQYQDISEWWKTHYNILKRSPDDMGALNYEGYPSMWDLLTTAIMDKDANEGKQLRSSMPFLRNG